MIDASQSKVVGMYKGTRCEAVRQALTYGNKQEASPLLIILILLRLNLVAEPLVAMCRLGYIYAESVKRTSSNGLLYLKSCTPDSVPDCFFRLSNFLLHPSAAGLMGYL